MEVNYHTPKLRPFLTYRLESSFNKMGGSRRKYLKNRRDRNQALEDLRKEAEKEPCVYDEIKCRRNKLRKNQEKEKRSLRRIVKIG